MCELTVFWNKDPVGKILDPQPDNLHPYEKWQPIASNYLDDFINDIQDTEDCLVC